MKVDDFLDLIRSELDKMGYKDYIRLKYGHILVQLNFENEKHALTIRERSTERV